MIVRPWQLGDTDNLKLQPAQEYMRGWSILSADLTDLSEAGLAWTAEHDGVILGIAGLSPQWENRAIAWALVSANAGKRFVRIHAAVKRFLEVAPYRRIEATVDVGFVEGMRWMDMLNFKYEGLLKAYRPDGADMLLYARIK
jgi:ribosomal protein S18 acetylase RimI-like enzyme